MKEELTQPIITRFAPSPTGFLHIGSVRTALYGYLLAKKTGGKFILRVEDTDKVREVQGGVEIIHQTLQALKLNWDQEFKQSDRLDIYKKWAEKLIQKGLAYADDIAPEEVEAWREDAKLNKKPFLYRDYITEGRKVEWVYGENVLRLKSNPKRWDWHDEVRGDLTAGPEAVDDLVLIKADGYPTYNFCHIVDDFEMGITHILRTDEFVSSTPKFLSIYESLEIQPPKFVTLPPIMAPGGKKKLGKRDGAKDALEYLADGVLVDGLINFLALLGWNPGKGNNQEIFTVDQLIEQFSIAGIGKSGANYDEKRLEWINGHHIRALSLDQLYNYCHPETPNRHPELDSGSNQKKDSEGIQNKSSLSNWRGAGGEANSPLASGGGQVSEASRGEANKNFMPKEAATFSESYQKQVLSLVQERLKFLNELPELTSFFFKKPELTKAQLLDVKGLETWSHPKTSNRHPELDSGSPENSAKFMITRSSNRPSPKASLSENLGSSLTPNPSPIGEGSTPGDNVEAIYNKTFTADSGSWNKIKDLAKDNRQNQTVAENLLWQGIRSSKLGIKFRRQHVVDGFILDFFSAEKGLALEVDGGYHNEAEQAEYDKMRQSLVEDYGITFLRFTNQEVENNLRAVLTKIKAAAAPLSKWRGVGGEAKTEAGDAKTGIGDSQSGGAEANAKFMISHTLNLIKNSDFSPEDLQLKLNQALEDLQTKPATLFALLRNALTGAQFTPPLNDTMSVLGKDEVVERLSLSLK